MKAIMIAAPSSNSGKSLICAGLISALRFKNLDVAGFKTGPDQVDKKLLELASGKYAGNIDMFMMGGSGIFKALGFAGTEYAIIEGVMGCFDGIGSTAQNSSFSHAEKLGINIVLVYSPQGEMFTIIPKLKGMIEYSHGIIKGIIMNKISGKLFSVYKKMIEDNLPELKVLGFVPNSDLLKTESNYLGLNLNTAGFDKSYFEKIAEEVSLHINTDEFLNLFVSCVCTAPKKYSKKFDVRIAISRDAAFNLYYTENIFILNQLCEVKYFSPLEDAALPSCEILYITGGAVNDFKMQLSENTGMRKSIKSFAGRGGFLIAEGEALNYLFEEYDGFEMCGIFAGTAESTANLQNFGYNTIEFSEDNILGKKGTRLNSCEYHKSKVKTNLPPALKVTKISSGETRHTGFIYKNVIGLYQNINFISCTELIERLLEKFICLETQRNS